MNVISGSFYVCIFTAEVCTRVGHSALKLVLCNTSKSEPIGAIPHTPSNSLLEHSWCSFCIVTEGL